jgi:gas vesicle protein
MNKLLIGFTAGAILGILYAPAKGSDTRHKLSNIGNDLKDGWNSVTDKIACSIDSMREGVDNIANKAVEKVESTQFETATV